MAPQTSKRLLRALTSPSKIASLLDRKGPVLSLDIHRRSIDMVLVAHPGAETEVLPSIPIASRRISTSCAEELADVVHRNHVCGFVISWPLQRDTGKTGAPCGRVLYTLESMLEQSEQGLLTPRRPACLWDRFHVLTKTKLMEDEWGRCASYSQASDKTIHFASKEQYHSNNDVAAADVLSEDFCRAHWPNLYGRKARRKLKLASGNLVADWRDRPPCLQAAIF